MAQIQLTELDQLVEQDDGSAMPRNEHEALTGLDTAGMEFATDAEGWRDFPHPADISSYLDDDVATEQAHLPPEVQAMLDNRADTPPDHGEFMVMGPREVYDYLAELQRQSDLHLENFYRRQLLVNALSNGHRNGTTTMVSDYDKRWLVQWEVRRRIAARGIDEWKECYLTTDNRGLPNS